MGAGGSRLSNGAGRVGVGLGVGSEGRTKGVGLVGSGSNCETVP